MEEGHGNEQQQVQDNTTGTDDGQTAQNTGTSTTPTVNNNLGPLQGQGGGQGASGGNNLNPQGASTSINFSHLYKQGK